MGRRTACSKVSRLPVRIVVELPGKARIENLKNLPLGKIPFPARMAV